MVHRFLFYIEQSYVMVIRFMEEKIERKLEYLPREGSKKFPIEDDFWEWWMKVVGYSDDKKDVVDFCFLYDKPYSMLKYDFPGVEDSVWKSDVIEEFLKEMTDYGHISLTSERGGKIEIHNGGRKFCNNEPKEFYTNVPLKGLKKGGNLSAGSELNEEKITPLAQYFRELLEQYKL